LNVLYTNTAHWKKETADLEVLKNVPRHLQLANAGSSHGHSSFDYNNSPVRAYNLSTTVHYHFYDFAVLQQFVGHFDRDAVFIILIEYFEITRIKTDFRNQRLRYYRYLEKQYLDGYSEEEHFVMKYFPVLAAGGGLRFIIKNIPEKSTVITEKTFVDDSTVFYKTWTTDAPSQWIFEAGEEGFAWNKAWNIKMIQFCLDHGIQPVLVSTPVTSFLNDVYAECYPEFFDQWFYRMTDELRAEYPSVPYFD
jgi:hypothetical protein